MSNYPLANKSPSGVTRDQLTNLLLESHKKSANSAEEVMAIREIAKLNGLYADSKETGIVVNIHHYEKQLKGLTDEELLQMAGGNQNLLSFPDPVEAEPIEAEFSEVKEDASME